LLLVCIPFILPYLENGGNTFWSAGTYLPNYLTSHPRRQQSCNDSVKTYEALGIYPSVLYRRTDASSSPLQKPYEANSKHCIYHTHYGQGTCSCWKLHSCFKAGHDNLLQTHL
jgi:hypothetical protein